MSDPNPDDQGHDSDSDHEKEEDAEARVIAVPYTSLFRFASTQEKVILGFGLLCAFSGGILNPVINNVQSDFIQTLREIDDKFCTSTLGYDVKNCDLGQGGKLYKSLKDTSWTLVWLAGVQFILGYGFCICLKSVSESQVFKTKAIYFQSLLRQNIAWHDAQNDAGAISRVAQNGSKMARATGENLGYCIFVFTSSIMSVGNAFYHDWKLTLLSLIFIPFLVAVNYFANYLELRCAEEQEIAYSGAGAAAAEALGNIRTVATYGGEVVEAGRYGAALKKSEEAGIRRGRAMGYSDGLNFLFLFGSTAFILYYGSCNRKGASNCSAETTLVVYLSLVMAAYDFGEGISYFDMFTEAKIAAGGFHSVIDRPSDIDPLAHVGLKPPRGIAGTIVLQDVHFSYPTRPGNKILQGISLHVEAGQTVAFVGHSGSGKSTIVQLLQRFYDPDAGTIKYDGVDIKEYDVGWMRSQFGVVSQEPVLFNGSIADNIRMVKPTASNEEIIAACRAANAHDFIMGFPDKYETMLGDGGALVSGGQKQRIAIARALITNPSVLFLDEATSALDVESEASVQAALDEASKGRTTVIVAHRLSTVKNAHVIFYIKEGRVLESGSPRSLVAKKGAYYQLLQSQHRKESASAEAKRKSDEKAQKSPSVMTQTFLPTPRAASASTDTLISDAPSEAKSEASIMRIWMFNEPELAWLILGFIMAGIQGGIHVYHGVVLGESINTYEDEGEARRATNGLALSCAGLAVLAGVSGFGKSFIFSLSGERLTYRLRSSVFACMLRQDMAWFDSKANHLGALCTRLSEDASLVQGATGIRMGNMLQNLVCVVASTTMACYYSWYLGILGFFLILGLNMVGYLEQSFLWEDVESDVEHMERGSMLMTQAVGQIKTIASLHIEEKMRQDFYTTILESKKSNLKSLQIRGLVMGLSQSFSYFAYVSLAYYGSYLMLVDGASLNVTKIVATCQFITFGTQVVAESMASAPNYYRAKVASRHILRLLDMVPGIKRDVGSLLSPNRVEGKIEFSRVVFAYPSRPTEVILNGLSFVTEPGKRIAVVGPSGSGKSTCTKLIQRFYDPGAGVVRLDGRPLTELDVESLRRIMSVVSQEPALFDRSIAENIAYGDNTRRVEMWEITDAAKRCNIHDFIITLADSYKTRVGKAGGRLSGGQKQRIAIARALIRNPSIFLLDEATSALDAQTEEIIQKTLDEVTEGHTTITISHRQAAVKRADLIFVLDRSGNLVEKGTHAQLMTNSAFYKEFMAQGAH